MPASSEHAHDSAPSSLGAFVDAAVSESRNDKPSKVTDAAGLQMNTPTTIAANESKRERPTLIIPHVSSKIKNDAIKHDPVLDPEMCVRIIQGEKPDAVSARSSDHHGPGGGPPIPESCPLFLGGEASGPDEMVQQHPLSAQVKFWSPLPFHHHLLRIYEKNLRVFCRFFAGIL